MGQHGEKLIAGTNWSRFEKASNFEVKAGLLPLPCSARSISGADKATTPLIPVGQAPARQTLEQVGSAAAQFFAIRVG